MDTHWITKNVCQQTTDILQQGLGSSKILATLLAGNGIKTVESAKHFLQPRLQDLKDPFEISCLRPAVKRLLEAIHKREMVYIIGDYDVDGVTSTTLLVSILREFGLRPEYFVPLRMEEGYGLSIAVLERVLERKKPDLLIALDCGTNSSQEVAFLRQKGIDVLIVDHHQSKESPSQDCILINPHVWDGEGKPWSNFCTVGLVFKLVHGLLKELRNQGNDTAHTLSLKEYLDLVAMGTIADLVPLLDENRILARYGLMRLQNTKRQGLHALFDVSGMNAGQEVLPNDVAFKLSPRINASGRLADAKLPIDMLLSPNYDYCLGIATALQDMNRERQDIEKTISDEAFKIAGNMVEKGKLGLVIFSESWHPGVVGIVAGKLCRSFHRPSIVLGLEGDMAKGSGRSIPGLNLVEILSQCSDLLEAWGGHPMAIGIAVHRSKVDAFKERFQDLVTKALNGVLPTPTLEISAWVDQKELGTTILEEFSMLHPFGQANPEPILGIHNVLLDRDPLIFGRDNAHCRFSIRCANNEYISCVAWHFGKNKPPVNKPTDFAIKIGWNRWNGKRIPQIEVLDWRLSQKSQ